ncbi:hypothetical protein D347_00786 [Enterococcus faecalis LA3B-2]|nr:hypothetical protein D347_00786 [Enterococcus faecalis LA3B-2]
MVQTDDFCIFNNILFRYHEEEFIRQIDHLVLTRKGLYALETKYWKGHIFHQMRVSDFDDSLKWLVPEKNNDYDFTFCIQNISKKDGSNLFKTILPDDSPFNQIKNNSTFLCKSLKEKNYPVRFIRPLVYYNYPKDKIHNVVVSKEKKLDTSSRISEGFTNRKALLKFFFEELKNNDTFSKDDFSKLNTFFKKEEKRMNL